VDVEATSLKVLNFHTVSPAFGLGNTITITLIEKLLDDYVKVTQGDFSL